MARVKDLGVHLTRSFSEEYQELRLSKKFESGALSVLYFSLVSQAYPP